MSGLTGNNIIAGSSGQVSGYNIDNSLRGGSGNNLQFSGAASNRKTLTFSTWIKRSDNLNAYGYLFSAGSNSSNYETLVFFPGTGPGVGASLHYQNFIGNSLQAYFSTEMSFRDSGAWYHIVFVKDTTNATAADRLKLYVNGELVDFVVSGTYGYTHIALNQEGYWNNGSANHYINGAIFGGVNRSYLAETHFIDGIALTAASFGETDADTNQWKPVEYEGSYGANGYYLKYQDSSALGDDYSGNNNDLTVTGYVATDQVLDSPTNNFSTINLLLNDYTTSWTLSEGNLKFSATSDSFKRSSFMLPSSGKWYCEVRIDDNTIPYMGVASLDPLLGTYNIVKGTFFYNNSGLNSSYVGYDGGNLVGYSNASNGDIVGIAHNSSNGETSYYLNNSLLRTVTTAHFSDDFTFYFAHGSSGGSSGMTVNFGQDSSFAGQTTAQGNGGVGEDFYYTPPTGYKALNTNNLDDSSIALPEEHFEAVVYVGDGNSTQEVTTSFEPDLIWNKNRTTVYHHRLFDRVRGLDKSVYSNLNSAEDTYQDYGYPTATSSTSVTVGQGTDTNKLINLNNQNYVLWNWKADSTSGSSNTDGTITSTVSANTTSGFSIVKYTGTGVAGDTMGHGLSQAPEMVIMKKRISNGSDGVRGWHVWAKYLTDGNYLSLNATNAQFNARDFGEVGNATYPYTAPTASLITFGGVNTGAYQEVNYNGDDYIMYCFHSVEGYSKVGSYTGNGSTDGTFFYTGFRPAFIMFKNTTATGNWVIVDNKRNTYNEINKTLWADLSSTEGTYAWGDFTSNGFKFRNTSNGLNNSGQNYIYLAIAESPFKYSNAR